MFVCFFPFFKLNLSRSTNKFDQSKGPLNRPSPRIDHTGIKIFFALWKTLYIVSIHLPHVNTLSYWSNMPQTLLKFSLKMSIFCPKIAMSPRFFRNAPCLAPVLSRGGHKNPRKKTKNQRNLTRFFTYRITTHALSLPPVGWEKKKRLANPRSGFSACIRDAVPALSIDPHAVHNTHRRAAGIAPVTAVHVNAGLPLCVRRAHAARSIHRVCT